MKRPSYSVVVAVDRIDKELPVLSGLQALSPDERPSAVFACAGHNPSLQRNLGAAQCRTPLVYFLDDDSVVIPGTVKELSSHFTDERTAVAGGPNIVRPDASPFEKTVTAVLASWLGSFKVRNRYAAIGSVKEATEKDLILCNMMMDRSIFLSCGGFRIDLYPNEENEFLNRLMHAGKRLVYDPKGAIYRARRKDLQAFCFQSFRYGRGRARQIKVYPCLSDLVHFIPAFFGLYLLTLIASFFGSSFIFQVLRSWFWWSPFILFWVLGLGTGFSAASWTRQPGDILRIPFLILLRHCFYGLGLAAGFLTTIPAPPLDVKVFKVVFKKSGHRFAPIATPKDRSKS